MFCRSLQNLDFWVSKPFLLKTLTVLWSSCLIKGSLRGNRKYWVGGLWHSNYTGIWWCGAHGGEKTPGNADLGINIVGMQKLRVSSFSPCILKGGKKSLFFFFFFKLSIHLMIPKGLTGSLQFTYKNLLQCGSRLSLYPLFSPLPSSTTHFCFSRNLSQAVPWGWNACEALPLIFPSRQIHP